MKKKIADTVFEDQEIGVRGSHSKTLTGCIRQNDSNHSKEFRSLKARKMKSIVYFLYCVLLDKQMNSQRISVSTIHEYYINSIGIAIMLY